MSRAFNPMALPHGTNGPPTNAPTCPLEPSRARA
jgi:hypothetical protein